MLVWGSYTGSEYSRNGRTIVVLVDSKIFVAMNRDCMQGYG